MYKNTYSEEDDDVICIFVKRCVNFLGKDVFSVLALLFIHSETAFVLLWLWLTLCCISVTIM